MFQLPYLSQNMLNDGNRRRLINIAKVSILAVLILVALVGALWAILIAHSFLIEKTHFFLTLQLPPGPSEGVKELLKNQRFYFTHHNYGNPRDNHIVESIGTQKWAKIIKQENQNQLFEYASPILSPDQRTLAFIQIQESCPDRDEALIQIVVMDVNTYQEKIVFATRVPYFPCKLPKDWTDYDDNRLAAATAIKKEIFEAIQWSRDSQNLEINILNLSYVYDLRNDHLSSNANAVKAQTAPREPCPTCILVTNNGRFEFYRERKGSAYLNGPVGQVTDYVKGIDRETKEEFFLTILSRHVQIDSL